MLDTIGKVAGERKSDLTNPKRQRGCSDVTDRLVPSVITLNVVEVREPNPPADEVAIHWILVTTLPIHTDEQIAAIVAACKIRWNIEVLFTTLKSGLHLEDLHYQELSRYLNAAVLLLVARLGGYIHTPAQGPPAVRTIWRGIRRLDTLAIAHRAFGPDTINAPHTYGL